MTQKLLHFYLPNSASQKLGFSQPHASQMSWTAALTHEKCHYTQPTCSGAVPTCAQDI